MKLDFLKKIDTFSEDGRKHISEIYEPFLKLGNTDRWLVDTIFTNKEIPVIVAYTAKIGPSIYITSGVQGEEPVGPNALAENTEYLDELAQKGYSIVVYPLINPIGYIKDWRYPNSHRGPSQEDLKMKDKDRRLESKYMTPENPRGFYSAADTQHHIMNTSTLPEMRPLLDMPLTYDVGALTRHMIDLFEVNPPVMHLDFHEDELLEDPYVYTAGRLKMNYDPVANGILEIMKGHGMPIPLFQKTRFDDLIVKGYGVSSPEGNLADLFSEQVLFVDGTPIIRPPARSAVTIEMPTKGKPLAERVKVYSDIIKKTEKLFKDLMEGTSSTYY